MLNTLRKFFGVGCFKNATSKIEQSTSSVININKLSHQECSVCISDFQKEEIVVILSCNHVYHKNCVEEWIKTKSNCPYCRKSV